MCEGSIGSSITQARTTLPNAMRNRPAASAEMIGTPRCAASAAVRTVARVGRCAQSQLVAAESASAQRLIDARVLASQLCTRRQRGRGRETLPPGPARSRSAHADTREEIAGQLRGAGAIGGAASHPRLRAVSGPRAASADVSRSMPSVALTAGWSTSARSVSGRVSLGTYDHRPSGSFEASERLNRRSIDTRAASSMPRHVT